MRNPLTMVTNQSKRATVAHGEYPAVPEAEFPYEGENHPYRGVETHGVPDTDSPKPEVGFADGRPVVYEEASEPEDAVPVRVVNQAARERRMSRVFHSFASVVGRDPMPILGNDDDRITARVKNLNTDIVWVGDSRETANAMHGYRLKQDEEYNTTSQGPLFAQGTHATDVTPLAVSVDYTLRMAMQDE